MGRPYDAQLRQKSDRLAAALAHFPHLELPAPAPILGSEWTEGYRHRLKLPIGHRNGRAIAGLYDPGTHAILDTPDCGVLAPRLREALPPLLAWLGGRTAIHSIDLRASAATRDLQLVLAVHGDLDGGARAARGLMAAIPGLVSVAVSRADPEGKRVMGSAPRLLAGVAQIAESIGETSYRLFPGAFFQVDPRQAARLHALVRRAAEGSRSVLDLYAGVGAYALALAPGRDRVVAVEEVPSAVDAARAVAPPNVEVVQSRVEAYVPEGRFDLVVLNPARRGADPVSLARAAGLAQRMVYVSCGPETLARDLDVLAAHGQRVKRIQPIDLFPQTPEVETVVELERGEPLVSWPAPGGRATGAWLGRPSGALGRTSEVIALVVGDTGPRGTLPGARFERMATVATHSLVRIAVQGSAVRALSALASRGHPVAGRDFATRRFFSEKAGLNREFIHVSAAGPVRAPLHGDLALALEALQDRPVVSSPRSRSTPRRSRR
ncbi:MAG: class I SAM-dependent RNA methyltransferase [Deltaproteobacteria bacterium]|nr:class I SAM-dependent RNA methyltransferase [Deltaproteobacteria bacterium]